MAGNRQLGESQVLRLVGLIYQAAQDPANWPSFLEAFAEDTGSTFTSLFVQDLSSQKNVLNIAVRVDPHYQKLYADYYCSVNPYLINGKDLLTPGRVLTGQQLVSDRELEKSEFCSDYLQPQSLFHMIGSVLHQKESVTANFTSLRGKDRAYNADERRMLSILVPHLQQAVAINRRLAFHALEQQVSRCVFDQVGLGIIVLDARGHIEHVNAEAQKICSRADGLSICRSALYAVDPYANRLLHQVQLRAFETIGKVLPPAPSSIAVPRTGGKRPYLVQVLTVIANPDLGGISGSAVVLLITDPQRKTDDAMIAVVRDCFGLTASEAEMAVALMDGDTISSAAVHFHITVSTARDRLKKLFYKTDTHSQATLVSVLHKVNSGKK